MGFNGKMEELINSAQSMAIRAVRVFVCSRYSPFCDGFPFFPVTTQG